MCVSSGDTLVGDQWFAVNAMEQDPELSDLTMEGEFGGVYPGSIVLLSGFWHLGSTLGCIGLSKVMSPTASVT